MFTTGEICRYYGVRVRINRLRRVTGGMVADVAVIGHNPWTIDHFSTAVDNLKKEYER